MSRPLLRRCACGEDVMTGAEGSWNQAAEGSRCRLSMIRLKSSIARRTEGAIEEYSDRLLS